MSASEKQIEAYLVQRAASLNGWAIKLLSTYVAGLPDRLVLMPGGRVAFVELKAPGEIPRRIQKFRHMRLGAMGFRVEVINSIEGVDALLESLCSDRS